MLCDTCCCAHTQSTLQSALEAAQASAAQAESRAHHQEALKSLEEVTSDKQGLELRVAALTKVGGWVGGWCVVTSCQSSYTKQ
jgi:hypothetical protein